MVYWLALKSPKHASEYFRCHMDGNTLVKDAPEVWSVMMPFTQISYIDGTSITAQNNLKLPDEHPGPEMTRIWAKQLVDYVDAQKISQ